MKLVKGLQKWIEGYNDVKTLTDELELAFDFYKDELVTEQEVDEAYAKALEHVENLELQNMLRDEADQMSCVLKINSGAGGTDAEVLERYAKLNLAPYKGFVNPVMKEVKNDKGDVTDIVLDYTEGYADQMLRYSKEYSFLPSYNE